MTRRPYRAILDARLELTAGDDSLTVCAMTGRDYDQNKGNPTFATGRLPDWLRCPTHLLWILRASTDYYNTRFQIYRFMRLYLWHVS